jgi:hypothetical protein
MDSEPALRRIFLDEEIERRPEEIEEGAAVDLDRVGQEVAVGLGQEGMEGGVDGLGLTGEGHGGGSPARTVCPSDRPPPLDARGSPDGDCRREQRRTEARRRVRSRR